MWKKLGCIAALLVSASPAAAQSNDWIFDKPYAQSGAWRIIASTEHGDTCVAETDNAKVTLRIMYTEYTGDWYVGVPYYEEGSPMASFGPGDFANDAIKMETWVVSGWAMHFFQSGSGMMQNLRGGQKVSIELDRGLQTWSLAGSSAAMDLMVQCAQNGGNKPAGSAAAPAAPAAPAVPATAAAPAAPAAPAPVIANTNGACPVPGSVKSAGSNAPAKVEFVDPAPGGKPKTVLWADFDGKLVEMGPLANGKMILDSYTGHKFVVRAAEGNCVGGPYEVKPGGNVFQVK